PFSATTTHPDLHSFPTRRSSDLTPDNVTAWQDVPAVPAAAFKELPLTCFPPEQAVLYFTTSGTTQAERQGTHYLLTPRLYNASRSEEHTSELQSLRHLVCRLLLE